MTRILLSLAALITVAPTMAQAQAPRRPNVILIVSDDHGYADLGCQGCKDIPTPHIDSLAKNGIRFTSGYVSHPYCSPTRAGLLTGRYQQRFGHEFNPGPPTDRTPGIGLPLSEVTFANRLRALGYKTGLVGKWHLGHTGDEFHPQSRGFDEFFGFLGGSHSYLKSGSGHTAIFRGKQEVQEKEYLTDAFAREGLSFVERHAKEPFFLYWAFNAVHGPMETTDKYLQRFPDIKDAKRRTFAGMLSALDDAVGRMLAKLRELGLEENTLIFFISDNGGPTAVNSSLNFPLRGFKGTTWEGGVRVPFLIQWKGHLPAGKTYDHPVICLDLLPTTLAAAKAPMQSGGKLDGGKLDGGKLDGGKLDGVNLLPYLNGEKTGPPHAALYWRFGGQLAIRMGDWKLTKSQEMGSAASRRAKATIDGAMLFNLKDDIGEKNDLAMKHPEKLKELSAAWLAWNSEMMAPRWGPPMGKKEKKKGKGEGK